LRRCLVDPIPEIFEAAANLAKAVDAHLAGDLDAAAHYFVIANDPVVWAFTDYAWGAGSKARNAFAQLAGQPPFLSRSDRPQPRMPTQLTQLTVLQRDGHHCRFCGIPVISDKIRKLAQASYPEAVPWGRTNISQHAAFQCMWLQLDHLLPNSRGGTSDPENVVVACAPCNFGRMEATLAEAQILDPLAIPVHSRWLGASEWDGLQRALVT
jgi:hypothetical protein